MKKLDPEYYFPICLLCVALGIFVVAMRKDSFAGGVLSTFMLWGADRERQKAADNIEKNKNKQTE
jgi:hypothetical protein